MKITTPDTSHLSEIEYQVYMKLIDLLKNICSMLDIFFSKNHPYRASSVHN